MKKIIALGALAMGATVMTSCGQGSARLVTEADSLAYAIGIDLGHMAYGFDSTLNVNILNQAIRDVYNHKSDSNMTRMEAQMYIQEYVNFGLGRKNLAAADEYLAQALKDGAVQGENNLVYKIDEPGSAEKAKIGDTIQVKYVLSLPNGTEIARNQREVDEFTLRPMELIPAWLEGVPLIGKGGKITLYVHPNLGYGDQGAGGAIGPNQALRFDIELVDVKPQADGE